MAMRTKFDLSLINSSFRSVFFFRRGRKDYFQLALSVHLRTQVQELTLTVLHAEAQLGWDEPVPELGQH